MAPVARARRVGGAPVGQYSRHMHPRTDQRGDSSGRASSSGAGLTCECAAHVGIISRRPLLGHGARPSLSMRRAAQIRGVEMRARPPLGSRVPGPPCGTPRRTQRVTSEWARCRRRQHPSERRWFLASASGFFLPRGAQKKKVSANVFATRARPALMASYTKFTSSHPVTTNF